MLQTRWAVTAFAFSAVASLTAIHARDASAKRTQMQSQYTHGTVSDDVVPNTLNTLSTMRIVELG